MAFDKYFFRRVEASLLRRTGVDARRFARNRARFEAAKADGRELIDIMPGIEMPMVISESMFLSSAYTEHKFEPDTIHFIKDCIKPGAVVIDVGANVGVFSLLFASTAGRGGRVVAFEPGDFAYDLLKRNRDLNNLKHLEIVQMGLGDSDGQATFYSGKPGLEVYNSLGVPLFVEKNIEGFTRVNIQVARGDTWCSARGIDEIDFLKIDVEGGELGVLKGFTQMLRGRRIKVVLFELTTAFSNTFGYQPSDVICMLTDFGYRCHRLQSFGRLVPFDGKFSDLSPLYVAMAD